MNGVVDLRDEIHKMAKVPAILGEIRRLSEIPCDSPTIPERLQIHFVAPRLFSTSLSLRTQTHEFTALDMCHKFIIEALHKWALVAFQHDFINLTEKQEKNREENMKKIAVSVSDGDYR
jgi:hypothetical protein